ncbi:MAG TPA: HAD hydrolase-like protein, partial [Verrucomicrobiae bacterium]|nr:HAD hydrolase-like protein [Verrucomicrobiae bacterium]
MGIPNFERVRAIVFDLDGTLIDSYEAIAVSLNHALGRAGRPPKTLAEVRLMVGLGLETLIERALGGPHGVAAAVEDF